VANAHTFGFAAPRRGHRSYRDMTSAEKSFSRARCRSPSAIGSDVVEATGEETGGAVSVA
jgi:hypothetical protein